MLVGIASDWIGIILNHTKQPMLIFTLLNILIILIPYYIYLTLEKKLIINWWNKNIKWIVILVEIIISLLILLINPLILKTMYNLKIPLFLMYLERLILLPIKIIINSIFFLLIYRFYLFYLSF